MPFRFDSSLEQTRMGSYFCKVAESKPPSFAKHRRYGMNTERLRTLALNLNHTSPRSPYAALGNVFQAVAARLVDKCRAELLGQSGSYEYNCPMDRMFFAATGVEAELLREFIATGADDNEVEAGISGEATGPEEAIGRWGRGLRRERMW